MYGFHICLLVLQLSYFKHILIAWSTCRVDISTTLTATSKTQALPSENRTKYAHTWRTWVPEEDHRPQVFNCDGSGRCSLSESSDCFNGDVDLLITTLVHDLGFSISPCLKPTLWSIPDQGITLSSFALTDCRILLDGSTVSFLSGQWQ